MWKTAIVNSLYFLVMQAGLNGHQILNTYRAGMDLDRFGSTKWLTPRNYV